MEVRILVGRSPIAGDGGICPYFRYRGDPWRFRMRWAPPPAVVACATINGDQNHYAVLRLSHHASPADIKRAYRLLARKYHPDVCKDSEAVKVFKRIRFAYDVLSNDAERSQYDQALQCQEISGKHWKGNLNCDAKFEDGVGLYSWADLKQKMHRERYREHFKEAEDDSSFYSGKDDTFEEETQDEEGASFIEVLRSAFLSLFLMQTVGCRLSLTFSTLMALVDSNLDAGYRFGYIIAWIMGGRGGILLTLCLSFTSCVCGKTSSGVVALVVVAMWVGSYLARYVPLPHGALLTLLYMSIKLHVDIK